MTKEIPIDKMTEAQLDKAIKEETLIYKRQTLKLMKMQNKKLMSMENLNFLREIM